MDLYREEILDHYKHPRNFGHLDHPTMVGEEHNVSCGDKIVIELVVSGGKKQKIDAISFFGTGCAISIASASMLTERAIGMDTKDVMKLGLTDVQSSLGTTLMPARVKCAMLSLEVLQKAINTK